jgi:hypothetical protein
LSKVNYEFVPVPSHIEEEIPQPALEKLYRILLRLYRRGVTNPPMRLLAKLMGKAIRTVQRYARALVSLGKLVILPQRITRNRNAPNIYSLIGLEGGVGDKFVVEKQGESTNTTTSAPTAAVEEIPVEVKPSKTRIAWEARQAKDAADHDWMLAGFVGRGKVWALAQLNKAYERTKWAMKANVGVWDGDPGPGMSDEEAMEVRAEMEQLDREENQRQAKQREYETAWHEAHAERRERLEAEFDSPEKIAEMRELENRLSMKIWGRVAYGK